MPDNAAVERAKQSWRKSTSSGLYQNMANFADSEKRETVKRIVASIRECGLYGNHIADQIERKFGGSVKG